jgi:hypothetical protein
MNNVLDGVANLWDFERGLKLLLYPHDVITLEFSHLLCLMAEKWFRMISDEYFTYFSFTVLGQILARQDLMLFDLAALPTHGGSLRVYADHDEDPGNALGPRVMDVKAR